MNRSRRTWSRLAGLLPVLLVFAQLTTALGFPAFATPAARTTPCGCPIDADRPASCCCTIGTRALTPGEPGSCCAKPKKTAAPLVAMLARGCHHSDGPPALPTLEPGVPPTAGDAPLPVPVSDAVRASNATTVSRPAIPPDPPPRLIG